MEFRHLLVKEEPPAAVIRLNRPEKRNALSFDLMDEMLVALQQVSSSSGIQVVVVEAAGSAFSAGHDLGEMTGREPAFYRRLFDVCTQMMERLHRIPQPVIAKVQGVATAAGCQLVAACDLAVAGDEARFGTPGVRIGLFCSTPMVAISRAIGPKRTMEMLLTGELVDARTALEWGLVNRVVPAAELDRAVDELVGAIARWSPRTIGIGKEAFYRQLDLDEHRAYELTASVMSTSSVTADAQEGICAFLEKRSPRWPDDPPSAS
jgi:enoyl-CoA hydratase/carnithine racemase